MLTHFAVFSHVSPFLFYSVVFMCGGNQRTPKTDHREVFCGRTRSARFRSSEPLGTMPCRAGEAGLAQRDFDTNVLPEGFSEGTMAFEGLAITNPSPFFVQRGTE